jgi:hypothetical protein
MVPSKKARFHKKVAASKWIVLFLMAFLGGASDAIAVTDIYYSIGTSTADLKTGSPTITISGNTATLSVAQTGNIGVGDVITYRTASKAYIKSIINQTTFLVQTAPGGAPGDCTNQPLNTINRTFNTLSGGLSGAAGASYLTSSNLVSLNVQLTFVFYFDSGSLVPDAAQLSGWTWITDSTRYIKLTSAEASMVASGASQRHTGKSGTGAGMVYSANWILDVDHMSYLRVEWLEFNMNSSGWTAGIRYREDGGEGSESLTVIGCIAYGGGLYGFYNTGGDNATYINCISHGNGYGFYTDSVSSGTSYFNCTAHGNTNNGFRTNGVHSSVKNCLSTGNTGDDYLADGTGTGFDGNTNASEDTTASTDISGTGNITGVSPASIYVSSSAPYNLHLTSGASSLINVGSGLSGNFTNDIDGDTRFGTWDIGADEFVTFSPINPMLVYTEDDSTATKDIIRFQTYRNYWSGEATAIDSDNSGFQYGHIARRSPNRNEVAVLFADSSSNKLYVTLYNGSTWTAKKELVGANVYKAYDAAYEQSTGRLMIVGSGTTNNKSIIYWIWDGSSWTVNGTEKTFLNAPGYPGIQGNNVTALRIASKPAANEIALIVTDDYGQVTGLIWSGSAWGNEALLTSANNQFSQAIAVEYQQTGTYAGRAIMAWGEGNDVKSMIWDTTFWDGPWPVRSGTQQPRWIRLAADPNSGKNPAWLH